MVKSSSAALLAVPLAASLLLAGCGGDEPKPDSQAGSTATTSPTTSPTRSGGSPTTTATTSAPTADPGIPAAARARTPAGAEAFVRYFFAQLNKAWSTPDPDALDPLYGPTCSTCSAIDATARTYRDKRRRYVGKPMTLQTVGSLGEAVVGSHEVLAVGVQEAATVVDSTGRVVERVKRAPSKFVLTLRWSASSWTATRMQVSP